MNTFAERLKMARVKANISQDQVSKNLGITRSNVSNWETGYYTPPLKLLPVLAEMYGLSGPLDFLPEMPTYNGLVAIQQKPVDERSYEEKIALAYGSSILVTSAPESVKKNIDAAFMKKAEEIQRQHDFMQRHRIMERFGGVVGADLVRELQEEWEEDGNGKYDDDILFAYHCLDDMKKDFVLFTLAICMMDQEHVKGFVGRWEREDIPRCVSTTVEALDSARKALKG